MTGNLVIADNVVDACLLPKDEALFAYDSAKLSEKAERTLALLARCFDTGPMRYQDLLVTGHTDPRGSDEYNLDLGLERAVAVRDYLVDEGVEDFRIEARSVGERRASNDPEDWDDDRKVEIQLAS
ncbi:OmpA family protein [Plesiocystis pacifica]|uniref:OmpA family protein n=1 Tax=Plesiocystis pacifica TaxID=191768 RepID=UPI001E3871B7|nr:OmpA family protein [Plesiocystis pacifica]